MLLGDGQHVDLRGREPRGEHAGEVLDEHADKALHRPEGRAVDHHWAVHLAVASLVGQIEALGQVVVHLDRAELPFASDDVLDHEVDLGSVEGGFTGLLGPGHAEAFRRITAGLLGLVPAGRVANVLRRIRVPKAHANTVVLHAERAEDDLHQFDAPQHFLRDLVLGHEKVRVVLGEATHPGHARDFARLFPTVHRAEFGQAQRQVAVGAGLRGVDLHVVRAIHRLEQVAFDVAGGHHVRQLAAGAALIGEPLHQVAFDQGRVLAVLIVGEVARRAVEIELSDVRREHLAVALPSKVVADEVLEFLPDDGAARRPEDEALADLFVHVEEPQFLAQLAVVALLRFLEACEGRFERLLRGLDQPVDANELFAVLITTPVGGGHRGQAHVHERRRGGHVRAKAEVIPVALAVDGRAVAVLEFVVDDFDLVRVVGKVLAQVALVQLHAFHRVVAAGDLVHFLLNRLEVAFADRLHGEIVVEAAIDGGTDGRLGVGVERRDRLGQQVGGRVAEDVHARVAVPRDAGDVAVLMERSRQVALDAVDGGRHAAVPAAEGVGDDFTCGDACRVLVDGAVGQRDVDHRHGTPSALGSGSTT